MNYNEKEGSEKQSSCVTPERELPELKFEKLPFLTGAQDYPDNQGLPTKLPFVLKFDEKLGLIIQKYSDETKMILEKTYKQGSLLSTSLGQGSFGVRRANEVLKYLLPICERPLSDLSFLEIGCGEGYLLYQLKLQGAKKVIGCEPGPISLESSEKFKIEIVNNFYSPRLFSDKFDIVFSSGVLEHINNPLVFLESQKETLSEKGQIFVAVPNCEKKFNLGDVNILGHEHWNYFTENSLKNLLVNCGFTNVESTIGENRAMIYAWGKKLSTNTLKAELDYSDTQNIYLNFNDKVEKINYLLKERIKNLEKSGKTLGFYSGGLNTIELLDLSAEPRFFNGDIKKHGKYYPGHRNPIEPPINLLFNKVDELWVMAIDYDQEIINYLKNELKLSPSVHIFSYKEFLENINLDVEPTPINYNSNKFGEGNEIYNLMKRLFPICRSITGNGVRETLSIIKEHIPLEIHEVPTGTKVFDWTIPQEWNIKDAYILDEKGNKIVDFKKNNLHVLGYSTPINKVVSLSELQEHLYSLPEQPEAVPYVTSYYDERWGFCISHNEREKLKEGNYKVVIDSELKPGSLTYGELIISGLSEKEVFLSTYICHPSLANDNLSGPAVTTFLAKWLLSKPRRFTYRIVFAPETIGSITYLSRNLDPIKKNIIAGFNLTCLGADTTYSFLSSRQENTLADRVALNILKFKCPDFIKYSFLNRGSDERQYCSPGVDLPFVSILRGKYVSYPEYHTSLDNMDFVTPKGLSGSYNILKECIELLEHNQKFRAKCLGEPQLGRRGLRSTVSIKSNINRARIIPNFLAYSDGSNNLIDISNKINVPVWELYPVIEKLKEEKLIVEENSL